MNVDAPVLELPAASEWALRRRQLGASVALANGCFDLLHVGHVRYLVAAAAEADALVVGINDDATVALLKGPSRPLLPAAVRAEMVAALRCVDMVTIFGDRTADRLIRELRPDVHCKGTDYVHGVPEAPTVESVGGRIAIVGDAKRHSTGELIDRLRPTDP
ncbi:MAG TPA: adenylyltransferase/cytidyltransferase family protein [Acidobacteriota bacterium]|nr:adenylyltransferase/cytidyltransferase family protein [Acidobacteriota bacterium]